MALVRLTKVTIDLARIGGTSGTFRAKLYAADEDGFPTGGVLALDSILVSSIPVYETFSTFDFTFNYNATVGERYCAIWQADGVVHDNMIAVATASSPQGIVLISSQDEGETWRNSIGEIFIKFWLNGIDAAPYGLGDEDGESTAPDGNLMFEASGPPPPPDSSFLGVNFTMVGDIPPAKATTPTPTDEATSQSPNLSGLSWEAG